MKHLLIAALLFCPVARGQVLLLSGGSSSLTPGSGASATLYLPDATIYGAIGYGAGRFQYAASDTFLWQKSIVTVGSKQIGFGFSGVGLGLNVDGISIEHKTKEFDVVLFAGAVGVSGYSTPFMISASNTHGGGGVFISRKFHDGVKLYNLEAVNGGLRTVAMGAQYDYRRTFSATLSAGIVNNAKLVDGSLTYHPWQSLNLYIGRQDYFSPFRATGDNAGVNYTWNQFSVGAALNESNSRAVTVKGESLTGSFREGILQEQVGYYHTSSRTLLNSNSVETINHRYIFSESVSRSNGVTSFSAGGGYTSNRLSVTLQHSIVFLLNGEGYQSVTGVSLSLKLPHDSAVNFQTVTVPTGQTLYTAYGTNYAQIGDAIPGQVVSHQIAGNFVISGICRDKEGPVSGCAVQVGKIIAYSNSQGEWSIRAKKKDAQAVAVLPAVFTAPGDWEVVSATAMAEPGKPTEIVVKRSQGVAVTTKPIADATAPTETPAAPHKNFWKRLWAAMTGRG
jgi:hypothetical protein